MKTNLKQIKLMKTSIFLSYENQKGSLSSRNGVRMYAKYNESQNSEAGIKGRQVCDRDDYNNNAYTDE